MTDRALDELASTIILPDSLEELAEFILAEHNAAEEALRKSVTHYMNSGDGLIKAKAAVRHGQWLPWLAKHYSDVHGDLIISERTASNYMRLARARSRIDPESSYRQALAFLREMRADEAAGPIIPPEPNRQRVADLKPSRKRDDPRARWRTGLTATEQAVIVIEIPAPADRAMLDDFDLEIRQAVAANLAQHPGRRIRAMANPAWGRDVIAFNPQWYAVGINARTAELIVGRGADDDARTLAVAAAADDATQYDVVLALLNGEVTPTAEEDEPADDLPSPFDQAGVASLLSQVEAAYAPVAVGEPKIQFASIEAAEAFIRQAQADLAKLKGGTDQ